MKTILNFYCLPALLVCLLFGAIGNQPDATQNTQLPLATEAFQLPKDMEVGLEIEARSPGTSWAHEGAEAAALLISVDGSYNQDLMLWAGDESFRYRVMLGHLTEGKHTVSVALNKARSAAGAQRAEVKSLRPLQLAIESNANLVAEDQLALAHSPVLYARANTIDHFTDLPLLMYYEILRQAGDDQIVRYTIIFTNEDGGTQTAALLARWGRGTDIEWVYEFRVRAGKIVEETYQGVKHETKPFTGTRTGGSHPLLAVASDNNNFSDLACSSVRFAPLPLRARLERATRESVMDLYPQTYRVMAEELRRENRISATPADLNTIADPREYFYIEATSQQEGTALAFEVKVADQPRSFSSDMGDARLRIDRSGFFRTAVRLPKGVSTAMVESITARCHAGPQTSRANPGCKHLKLIRVFMLDQDYVPRPIPLQPEPESSLAPDETKLFRLGL